MPIPRNPSLIRRITFAICDADRSLEDIKHRHRCRLRGCLAGEGICMAKRQAEAVMDLLAAQDVPGVKDIAA